MTIAAKDKGKLKGTAVMAALVIIIAFTSGMKLILVLRYIAIASALIKIDVPVKISLKAEAKGNSFKVSTPINSAALLIKARAAP